MGLVVPSTNSHHAVSIKLSSRHSPPMPSSPLANGVYRIFDGGERWLSRSGVKPGTGAGTQLVMLTEAEGTTEGFNVCHVVFEWRWLTHMSSGNCSMTQCKRLTQYTMWRVDYMRHSKAPQPRMRTWGHTRNQSTLILNPLGRRVIGKLYLGVPSKNI